MKNIILSLIINLMLFSTTINYAMAQQQAVVAVVNDEPITDLDIQKRADLLIKSSGMNPDAKTIKLMKEHVLYGLIDEKLIASEAKSKNIEVDDADLAFAMNSIAEKNGISIMELDTFLAKTGVNKSVLEDQITSQLLLNKYMRTLLMPKISVSEKEIEESRGTLVKALSKSKNKISQVKLAEIVLYPKYNKKDAEMPLAEKLVSEIRSGADFATLAKEFSDSSSAASGGNIGWVYIDQTIPEISNSLSSLEVGQVTNPIVLNDGIHILKAVDMKFKQDNSVPEKIDDEQIKDVLLNKKLDLQVKGLIRKLRRDSYVSFKKTN